jgi:hypothetical protein
MKKILFLLFLSGLHITSYAQKEKFGKYNSNEMAYSEVDFEPDADAVMLFEEGVSKFFGDVFETSYHFRMKILKESGISRGDVTIPFYSGDNRTEEISSVKALITNFEGGQAQTIKVEKDQIFEVEVANGWKEVRITFPNVKVGSIIEYTYKKTDKNITMLDGWTFQNDIPTIMSTYSITMLPQLEYKMIGQGEKYNTTSEKTASNGTYSWTLRKLNSLKAEPYMKNFADYRERVEFQLSRYQKSLSEWEDVLQNWVVLGNEVLKDYDEKGYFRTAPLDKATVGADFEGSTELEKAKKAYYYIQENFQINDERGFFPDQWINQLMKSKIGSPLELDLALMGILTSLGIECHPILVGSKGSGRSDLVPFPFINQFNSMVLLAKLDGNEYLLDLEDPIAPFGYVDLDKHVKAGLLLIKDNSQLVPISIPHNSNSIFISQLKFDEANNLMVEGNLRQSYYEGLVTAQRSHDLEKSNRPLHELFTLDPNWEVVEFEVEDKMRENNFTTTNYKLRIPGPESDNLDLIMLSPFKIATFSKNPFTQDFRIFPVDFGFAFSETYTAMVEIPAGYELDDYPLKESITMENGEVVFQYNPIIMNDKVQISAKVEIRKPKIDVRQYGNLKYFMESIATKMNAPIVFKKVVDP